MKVVLAIARRELESYFTTVIGWVFLLAFVLINGWFFASLMGQLIYYNSRGYSFDINTEVIPAFFSTVIIMVCFFAPALSMRTFSVEMKQKSFDLLLSSPISSSQIVLGKFMGAMGYIGIALLSLIHCTLFLYWIGEPDIGILLVNYLATFLTAACCISVGMLFSSFTPNQLIALVLSFISIVILMLLADLGGENWWVEALSYASMLSHIEYLCQGLIQTKDMVYFLSFIFLFLFATLQRIEAYRW